MSIAVSGLASGMDVDGIISQLLAVERQPIFALQRRIAQAEGKQAAYNDLGGRLASLTKAVEKLNDPSLFGKRTVSSKNSALVSATATDQAPEGLYRLRVLQTATKHRIASAGFVDRDSTGVAAGAGTFQFRLGGGALHTLNVDGATTLQDLADAINGESANIQASIVNDGTAADAFRLVLASTKEGRANTIEIVQNDTTLNLSTKAIEAATADAGNAVDYLGTVTASGAYTGSANSTFLVEVLQDGDAGGGPGAATYRFSTDGGLSFDDNGGAGYTVSDAAPLALADGVAISFTNSGTLRAGDTFRIDVSTPEIDAAQDAVINVDGINIVKETNIISDVFDGITFYLHEADASQLVDVTVRDEPGDLDGALTNFIGAYNGVAGYLDAQFSYDPTQDKGPRPPLAGDSAARGILFQLQRSVTGRIGGLGSSSLSALVEVGVSTNPKTGVLSLDSAKLRSVLDQNPDAVRRLLTSFGEVLEGGTARFMARSADTRPGTYDVRVIQARERAQVAGGMAAETLLQDERLSFRFNADAQNPLSVPTALDVDLLAGDTPGVYVSKLNGAFGANNLGMEAYLDAGGTLQIRSTAYGDDDQIEIVSSVVAGVGLGTTGIDTLQLSDTGVDLQGMIGGSPADVVGGNRLVARGGLATDGIEVIVEDTGSTGRVAQVRITDGLAAFLPDVVGRLGTTSGVLSNRSDGLRRSIESMGDQITRHEDRITQVEARLRTQFTALEVTLSQLQATGDYLTQQLAALNPS